MPYKYIEHFNRIDQVPIPLHPHTRFVSPTPRASMQELNFLEFFAGEGRVWKTVAVGMPSTPTVGVDINYGKKDSDSTKTDPFDILTSSGFACHPEFLMFSIQLIEFFPRYPSICIEVFLIDMGKGAYTHNK